MDDLAAIIGSIPQLAQFDGTSVRLGGLTNRVWRLGDHVLRIPGEGTAEYINREHEAIMARLAAKAGVSPEVVFSDPDSGLMVTRYLDGAVTMTPDLFHDRPGAVARAAEVLRRLHHSGAEFPFDFGLFGMIDSYLGILATTDVALPDGYHDLVAEAAKVGAILAARPVRRVACHCDPLCENFLDVDGRMWIVDWEYSGMNDPMWDLGDLSVEGRFDGDQDEALLAAYFQGDVLPADRGRMVIYKAMCDLLWTLWGLIQLANGNPADDFRSYADGRFARCRALMASPDFDRHLAAIAG